MHRSDFLTLPLATAGLLIFSTPVPAQEGEGPPPAVRSDSGRRMFDPVKRLLERKSELAITDEQARQLEAIRTRYLEKNRPLVDRLRRERDARRALRASMDSVRTEALAVLTPEQKTRLHELRKKWHEERRREGHGRRPGGWHHGEGGTDHRSGEPRGEKPDSTGGQ